MAIHHALLVSFFQFWWLTKSSVFTFKSQFVPYLFHTSPMNCPYLSGYKSTLLLLKFPKFTRFPPKNCPKHPRFSPCFRHGAVAPIAGMAPGHHAAIRLQHREAARGAVPDEVRTADHGGDLERWWGWESWGDDVFVGDFCRESWESVRIWRYS